MQWIEVKVAFQSENPSLAVDLIAQAFYDLQAKGVVVEDPDLQPEEPWGPDAVPLPARPAVIGYLPADAQLEARRQLLEQALANLAADNGIDCFAEYRSIDEEDWAESWKAFFWPREITSTIVVKPTWRDYDPQPGQQVIEIDPGMAFGTGTHPTTSLCIALLEKYLQPDDNVLDIGTGSGILLIAAARLGADRLSGIDLDPMAVEVAAGNLARNGIQADRFDLHCGDLADTVSGTYDLVVANILAEVILELLDDVAPILKPGGIFICSGIIEALQTKVARNLAAIGFDILKIDNQGAWVAMASQRK